MICFEEFMNILESRGRDAYIYFKGEWVGKFHNETKMFQIITPIPVDALYGEEQWEARYL